MVLAVVERVLLHVLRRHHAGPAAVLPREVRRVERRDRDAEVQPALPVVRLVELAVARERVADEQQAVRLQPLDRVHVQLRHRVRLRHDDEQLVGVEALDVVRVVRREAERETPLVDAVRGLEHPAAEDIRRRRVRLPHLLPDDLVDLPLRRAHHDGLALRARLRPPEHGPRRRPVLAGSVRPDDRDPPVIDERVEHLRLLRVRRSGVAEHVPHEPDRVVRVPRQACRSCAGRNPALLSCLFFCHLLHLYLLVPLIRSFLRRQEPRPPQLSLLLPRVHLSHPDKPHPVIRPRLVIRPLSSSALSRHPPSLVIPAKAGIHGAPVNVNSPLALAEGAAFLLRLARRDQCARPTRRALPSCGTGRHPRKWRVSHV